MAKKKKLVTPPPPAASPKWPLLLGGAIVLALVGFAIVRTTKDQPADASVATASSPAPAVAADTAASQTESVPSTLPPLESARPQSVPPVATSTTAESAVEPHASQVAHVPRITPEDLHQKFEAKDVTIVDVRDAASYSMGHIEGALHFPFASIASESARIPKDKPIVLYCT